MKVMYDHYNSDSDRYDPTYVSPYSYEIKLWEDQQWERSENGIWFWNNGVATYITGFYYWYLTEWQTYFGYPDYRETDKEITYFIKYCEDDPNSFGMLLNTIRRYGKSALMGAWIINRTSRHEKWFGGMQGENDKKIKKFWDLHVLKPFRKLFPNVLPTFDVSSKLTEDIKFQRKIDQGKAQLDIRIDDDDIDNDEADDTDDEGLESYLDHRASGEGEYDQAVLHSYLMEEPGKCLAINTLVRMFDGTVKKVQDVIVGDLLRGDDNEPRFVKRLGRGFGKIYKIIPNSKAEPWYVNEHHILSCKVSDDRRFPGYTKGDVINIEVRDYLKLNKDRQRHLMCYRVGVEYPEITHNIDSYFLGVWLGDGDSARANITNEDSEVIDWILSKFDAVLHNPVNRTQRCSVRQGLTKLLKNKNLLKNKHIPSEYLIDSRKNRLELLAGLIDTDGHRCIKPDRPNQRYYEIIQKNKNLSEDIRELCLSLGYYASLRQKIATMKRKDGTIYRCPVYRISIFGRDLHEIPCKIPRKQMPKNITTYNSKDPSIYGFKVEYDRDDNYYGFNISGNRLYLLGDYTVTHNTLIANVSMRWETVKPCLKRGIFIRGKAFLGTTVEHMDVMDKGGKAYQKIFYQSDFNRRTELNQTESGLYAAFLPGDCALEGYFDEWGHPMREAARRHIILERQAKKKNPKDYSNLIRKYPLTIAEIFWVNTDRCEFNADILQTRKLELDSSTVPFWSKFDLAWENNKRFSKVIFRHNEQNGWFKASWMFSDVLKDGNKVQTISAGGINRYAPLNEFKFTSGVDPIDHGVVITDKIGAGEDEYTSTRRSKPVLLVKRRYDTAIDGELTQEILEKRAEEKYQYQTGVYIGLMDTRPTDPNVFYERALMICWLFGMSINVESQKPGLINYFYLNNCGDFIKTKYTPEGVKHNAASQQDGTPASSMMIQQYTGAIATHIEYFGHMMPFVDVTNDNLIFNPLKTKEHDHTVAMGWCELGEMINPKRVHRPIMELSDILPIFDEQGNVLN